MTKRSSPAGSGRRRRRAVRKGYKVIALLLKPSLGLFGLVGRRRVLLPHPGSATGHLIAPGDHHILQHIQVHFGIDFQADFEDVRWHDVALTWNHTEDHNRSRKLCFHHPGHVPVIRGILDLHFEGAGNGPVVISWIGREHELYSGASPISLVEHSVTFRHDRKLLLLLGFVHNWPTSRWSATKKENRFSLNGNGIMSSFLGRQFYRCTLYKFMRDFVYIYIYIYIYIYKHVLLKTVKYFLFRIFKWRCSSLLITFLMSGSRCRRKCPLLAQTLSTISLVVLRDCVCYCELRSVFMFIWSGFF